jgi:predicted TIM-barrel fold metal-dependent hydrolase
MDTNNTKKSFPRLKDFLIGICVGVVVFYALHAITNLTCSHPKQNLSEQTRPHSPYLLERETLDDGFSRGWMPHFLPSEEYWIDLRVHLRGVTGMDNLKTMLDEWFARLDAYRLGKIVAMVSQDDVFEVLGETSKTDSRFAWMFRPVITEPSLTQIQDAIRHGARAVIIHNSPIMSGTAPRNIYENEEWQAIFTFAQAEGIPLLWHITQRHSYSPYHGGSAAPYWSSGWKVGVTFTNEDLLQDVLAIMRKYPKLKIIGAQQIYVGIDRLTQLFKEYENLYIDSSVGMYLRISDEFLEEDRLLLRDFVETWSERILFGSDATLFPGSVDEYAVQGFLAHTRFMQKLGLSDKALQDVTWRTTQQLLNLKSVSSARRGNVRP